MDDIFGQFLKVIDMAPPWFGAMLMAMLVSVLRVVYDRKESSKVRMALEGAICGALTVSVSSAITALGYDHSWDMFMGGFIGFMGSQYIRAVAVSIVNKKVNTKKNSD